MKQFLCSVLLVPWMAGIVLAHVLVPAQDAVAQTAQLTWQDNSANEEAFIVERKPGAGGPYTEVGRVLANIITYTDPVQYGESWCWRIKATNAGGTSEPSNIVCATASPPTVLPPTPEAPSNTTVTVNISVTVQGAPTPPAEGRQHDHTD